MVRRSTCMGGTIPDGTDLALAKDQFSVSEKAVGAVTVEYPGGAAVVLRSGIRGSSSTGRTVTRQPEPARWTDGPVCHLDQGCNSHQSAGMRSEARLVVTE
jgi:hypothetical protein